MNNFKSLLQDKLRDAEITPDVIPEIKWSEANKNDAAPLAWMLRYKLIGGIALVLIAAIFLSTFGEYNSDEMIESELSTKEGALVDEEITNQKSTLVKSNQTSASTFEKDKIVHPNTGEFKTQVGAKIERSFQNKEVSITPTRSSNQNAINKSKSNFQSKKQSLSSSDKGITKNNSFSINSTNNNQSTQQNAFLPKDHSPKGVERININALESIASLHVKLPISPIRLPLGSVDFLKEKSEGKFSIGINTEVHKTMICKDNTGLMYGMSVALSHPVYKGLSVSAALGFYAHQYSVVNTAEFNSEFIGTDKLPEYYRYSNQIEEADIASTYIALPITLSYEVPISQHWAVTASIGQRFAYELDQQFTYTGQNFDESFEAPDLEGLTMGWTSLQAGVCYNWGNLSLFGSASYLRSTTTIGYDLMSVNGVGANLGCKIGL